MLEPVRRDEVEAAVDHAVVVHEPVGLAPRHLLLRVQVLLEELLFSVRAGISGRGRG